jgi:hypothetical protein
VGLKKKNLNLDVKNIFAVSHTEHCWRCRGALRASPKVLSMWSCTAKLDKEKANHASVGEQNWFWPNIFVALFAPAGERA